MCGHFGMMGPGISQADVRFIRELAYVSGLRGTDGTGVLQGVTYKKHNKGFYYVVEKLPSEVSYYLWYHSNNEKGDKEILNSVTDTFMAGHVRAATRGANCMDNTHPFELEEIVGMHNGTLWDKKYEHKTKTDSELFFKDIEENGPMKVLSSLDKKSAYAIVMLNLVTGEFTFAHNEHRPLACAWNTRRRVFYWASEVEMLRFVAQRNNIEIEKFFEFTRDMLHTFRPYDVNVGSKPNWKLQKIEAPVVTPPIMGTPQSRFQDKNKNSVWTPTDHVGHNVIRLLPPAPGIKTTPKRRREELMVKCFMCKCDMDPLDQHLGTELLDGSYTCKACDELSLEVAKSIN